MTTEIRILYPRIGVKARPALLIGTLLLSACAATQGVPQIPPNLVRPEFTSEPTGIISPQAVPKTLPDTPTPSERPEVDASLQRLSAEGFKVLACRYLGELGTTQRTQTAYFWYQRVGMQQKDLVFISPGHTLAGLGDTALSECPPTRADAQRLIDAAFSKYSLYDSMRNDNPWRTPPDPQAPNPVGCVQFVEERTVQNQCGFPVVFKWCNQRSPQPCVPQWPELLLAGQAHHFTVIGTYALRVQACPSPYVPVLPDRYNLNNWEGLPWRCQRDSPPQHK